MRWLIFTVSLLLVACGEEPREEIEPPLDVLEMIENMRCVREDGKVLYIHKGQVARGDPRTSKITYVDRVTGKKVEMIDDGRWKCVPAAKMPESS